MGFFDVHSHKIPLDKNTFSITNTYPNSIDFSKPFSIGIHPWYINKNKIEEELLLIKEIIQKDNCLAIGECGLDKKVEVDIEIQKEVFKKQVSLSEKYNKPVIIHCVKSYQEIIEFKKELKPKQYWVMHGFNKNSQIAESLLKNGVFLSIGAEIIKNEKLQEVVSSIPISLILLETDDSNIQIQEIYMKIASIKNIELRVLQQKIKENFKKIFKV